MTDKTHIYFMPGLAASPQIFEYINLPTDKYECHYLEWIVPESKRESLKSYAKRLLNQIHHEDIVLIGVSFGGILVQEIGKIIKIKKAIIISSIKNELEMPKRLKYLRYSKVYKLFPTKKIESIDDFSRFELNQKLKKKVALYNKYLAVRDEKYLNWAVYNVLHWKNETPQIQVSHIHGTKDEIFPFKYIKDCIPIEGGSHAMIIINAKKIAAILENLLST